MARRLPPRHAESWPINPAASKPPEGGTGWSEGKKFAFVLTHDVEGRHGLERCRALAMNSSGYGVHLYENFLRYVAERYGQAAWFGLPRDVTKFFHALHAPRALQAR